MDLSGNVYAELRTISNVGVEVGIVRGLLSEPKPSRDDILPHLRYAIGGLDQFIQVGQGYGPKGGTAMQQGYVPIDRAAASARGRLQAVLDRLSLERHRMPPRQAKMRAAQWTWP